MTYTQMECFIEAAKTGSFSKAGENLFISQQTVSRQIHALEKELDVALFTRKNKGVELTEAGEYFYKEENDLLERHKQAVNKVREMQQEKASLVCIGVRNFGEETMRQVQKCLLNYSLKYPHVNIDQSVEPAQLLLEHLQDGAADIIITYASELQKSRNAHFILLPGTAQEIGLVISRRHRLAAKRSLKPEDLKDEVWGVIGESGAMAYSEKFRHWLASHVPEAAANIREYPTQQSLALALAAGKCVALVYRGIISDYEDQLKFYPQFVEDNDPGMVIAWIEDRMEKQAGRIAAMFHQEPLI